MTASGFSEMQARLVSVGVSCRSVRIFGVKLKICMSLARVCNDPVLKERYEDLALDFARNAGSQERPRRR